MDLTSLDPPVVRRDCNGHAVLRATETSMDPAGFHTGSCTYDAAGAIGIITSSTTAPMGSTAVVLNGPHLRP